MSKTNRLRLAFFGEGEGAERWAAALGGLAQVCLRPERLPESIDAVVIAPGARHPVARAQEALEAAVPVLYAAPFRLSPRQATNLQELSERQGTVLCFAEPFLHRPGFAFLRRLLGGKEPIWHPLYLRTLCLAQPESGVRLDELAAEELAMCQGLLESEPLQVTAVASRRDSVGELCAVFLTVQYRHGPLVQCTVSLAEAVMARRLIAAAQGRTIILDELDPVSPLRIVAGSEPEPFLRYSGEPAARGHADSRSCKRRSDPIIEEAKRFVEAVSSGDGSAANVERWVRVAMLWRAARRSVSLGAPVAVAPLMPRKTEPPPLKVMRGGGKAGSPAGRRPALTLVAS